MEYDPFIREWVAIYNIVSGKRYEQEITARESSNLYSIVDRKQLSTNSSIYYFIVLSKETNTKYVLFSIGNTNKTDFEEYIDDFLNNMNEDILKDTSYKYVVAGHYNGCMLTLKSAYLMYLYLKSKDKLKKFYNITYLGSSPVRWFKSEYNKEFKDLKNIRIFIFGNFDILKNIRPLEQVTLEEVKIILNYIDISEDAKQKVIDELWDGDTLDVIDNKKDMNDLDYTDNPETIVGDDEKELLYNKIQLLRKYGVPEFILKKRVEIDLDCFYFKGEEMHYSPFYLLFSYDMTSETPRIISKKINIDLRNIEFGGDEDFDYTYKFSAMSRKLCNYNHSWNIYSKQIINSIESYDESYVSNRDNYISSFYRGILGGGGGGRGNRHKRKNRKTSRRRRRPRRKTRRRRCK